jgi:hypothetical protein
VERYIDHIKQRATVLQDLHIIHSEFMQRFYKHICTCNGYIASESLKCKTPLEVATGGTPDISHIRFYFYQPVWYISPTSKAGETRYLKGNFIGFSDTVGDNFSYEIAVKKSRSSKAKTLSRTLVFPWDLQDSALPGQSNPSTLFPRPVVPSAGRNRKTTSECDTGSGTKRALETGTGQHIQEEGGNKKSLRKKSNQKPTVQQEMEDTENIAPTMTFDSPDNDNRGEFSSDPLAYQNDIEGVPQLDVTGDNSVESIMSHKWVPSAGWTFDVTLMGISNGSDRLRVSFDDLKTDVTYMLAQYVLRNKIGSRSGKTSPAGKIMDWARNHLDSHMRLILRVRRIYGMSGQFSNESKWESLRFTSMPKSEEAPKRVRVDRSKSGCNRLKHQVMGTLKYGIRVPRNVKQALLMDQENDNTY